MNKKDLTERDICTKYITPAVEPAGWEVLTQIREEVYFTKGRISVRGKLVTGGKRKRADYLPVQQTEHPAGPDRSQGQPPRRPRWQGLDHAGTIKIRFVFSSNGDDIVLSHYGPPVLRPVFGGVDSVSMTN